MAKSTKTFLVGRDSSTGRLISPAAAKAQPSTTTLERMPKAGHGDTKSTSKK